MHDMDVIRAAAGYGGIAHATRRMRIDAGVFFHLARRWWSPLWSKRSGIEFVEQFPAFVDAFPDALAVFIEIV